MLANMLLAVKFLAVTAAIAAILLVIIVAVLRVQHWGKLARLRKNDKTKIVGIFHPNW